MLEFPSHARSLIFQKLGELRMSSRKWMASARCLPDFLVIGAQRGGTTMLYHSLSTHPQVMHSVYKEVHYFDIHYECGADWYRAHFPLELQRHGLERLTGRKVIVGEASPYYLIDPETPPRVQHDLPRARLICLLRNPVERAYSHYIWMLASKLETLSFEQAIECEPARLAGIQGSQSLQNPGLRFEHQHHSYLARGIYIDQLRRWRACFAPEQMLIMQSETFFADPQGALARIQAFLGIDQVSLKLPRAIPNRQQYPKMQAETRRYLTEFFEPYNHQLFDFLGETYSWNSSLDKSSAILPLRKIAPW